MIQLLLSLFLRQTYNSNKLHNEHKIFVFHEIPKVNNNAGRSSKQASKIIIGSKMGMKESSNLSAFVAQVLLLAA